MATVKLWLWSYTSRLAYFESMFSFISNLHRIMQVLLENYVKLWNRWGHRSSHLIPPENIRKLLVFWCFQGVSNGNTGQKWDKNVIICRLNYNLCHKVVGFEKLLICSVFLHQRVALLAKHYVFTMSIYPQEFGQF